MEISEMMSTDVMTVAMDNTVEEIRALFEQNDCHHILIVSDSNMSRELSATRRAKTE